MPVDVENNGIEVDQNENTEIEQEQVETQQPQTEMIPKERFDQVYANAKEMERQNRVLMEKMTELTTSIIKNQTSGQQQQEEENDPLADMDPDEKARMEAIIERATAPLKQQLAQVTGTLTAKQRSERFEQMKQMIGDEEVAKKADEFLDDWKKKGYSGWTEEDAAIYALGVTEMQKRSNASQPRNERGQFNRTPGPITGASGNARSAPRKKDPDQMTPEEQVAYYEQQLEGKSF